MAYCCNLATKTISKIDFMSQIKDLLNFFHAYFKFSPKNYLEFIRYAKLIEKMAKAPKEYEDLVGLFH